MDEVLVCQIILHIKSIVMGNIPRPGMSCKAVKCLSPRIRTIYDHNILGPVFNHYI